MKVVHVITGLNQGGAEAMLEKLVLTGRRMNPEIEQSVINLGAPGAVGRRLELVGVKVESLGITPALSSLGRLAHLTRVLRSEPRTTVVQTWLWHADLIGGLCARAAGNRNVVWNLRNSMPAHTATKRASRAVARLCAWLSSQVPAVIVCNSAAALRAHLAIGYRAEKCIVVPNGFDLRTFVNSGRSREEVRMLWRVAPNETLVGMVARCSGRVWGDPGCHHSKSARAVKSRWPVHR
jgi:hypothetical protein